MLELTKYENEDIGDGLLRVLTYYTMKSQFDNVETKLADIGVTKVEPTKEGLKFHFENVNFKGTNNVDSILARP